MLSSEWVAVVELVHGLGSVRQWADSLRSLTTERAVLEAIERAIRDACRAVEKTVDDPRDEDAIRVAWAQIERAHLATDRLHHETARAREAGARAAALREHARDLIAQAMRSRRRR